MSRSTERDETLSEKWLHQFPDGFFDMIIIDEAHHFGQARQPDSPLGGELVRGLGERYAALSKRAALPL